MTIIKANSSHKQSVLDILDEFRDVCDRMLNPTNTTHSTTARNHGGQVFDNVIDSPTSAIFLAEERGQYVGIITIHSVPRLRRDMYYGEIEEIYVKEAYQGTGVAQQLIKAAENWARESGITTINIKSGSVLERAHAFYRKSGYREYAKGFKKML